MTHVEKGIIAHRSVSKGTACSHLLRGHLGSSWEGRVLHHGAVTDAVHTLCVVRGMHECQYI